MIQGYGFESLSKEYRISKKKKLNLTLTVL